MQQLAKTIVPQIQLGQRLKGSKSVYRICGQLRADNYDVWVAW